MFKDLKKIAINIVEYFKKKKYSDVNFAFKETESLPQTKIFKSL